MKGVLPNTVLGLSNVVVTHAGVGKTVFGVTKGVAQIHMKRVSPRTVVRVSNVIVTHAGVGKTVLHVPRWRAT